MANLQRYGGGAAGVAAPVAARQFLDEPGQSRLTQPSVLAGVGTGVLAGGLYLTDAVDVPVVGDDFLAAHAITSTPLGLFYAAFPKRRGTTAVQQVKERIGFLGGGKQRRNTGGSGGGKAKAGSTEVATQGHSMRRRSGSA